MPPFRYTLTIRATEKDDYNNADRSSADAFINDFVRRGVKSGEKDGSGIIGAIFKPGSHLEQKNVEMVTAVILDVDGKFKKDGEVVNEPVDPDWFIAQLPWRGIAHTSYNNSPTLPKYRVILPLERAITVEQHRRLWYWVFERVHRKIDTSCKNADRMYYLARAPADALKNGWPWVREMHGPQLSFDAVPADYVLPNDAVPFIKTRKQGAHTADPETYVKYTDGGLLLTALMALPIVKWAIDHPSEVSREVWRGLATNIAAVSREHPDDEDLYGECLQAFHTISEADGNRYSASETNRIFADARSGKSPPITYAHMVENGAPDSVYDKTCKVPVIEARRRVPREEPPKAEAPASVPTGAETGAALAVVPADTTSIDSLFEQDPEKFIYDATVDHYRTCDKTGSWDTIKPISLQSLNAMMMRWGLILPKQRDNFRAQIRYINAHRPFYDQPNQIYVEQNGVAFLNTYRATDLVPTAGNWDDIHELLVNIVGGDMAGLEYVLDWIAAPLQRLHLKGEPRKMGVALVLQGQQGSGKGTLHRVLECIYGVYNMALISQDGLDSKYNDEVADKLFVTANEVISSTNRSMEVANKLKMWITDPKIPIEIKFMGREAKDNNFNIMFLSNDEKPVILEKDDRRYAAFRSKKLRPGLGERIIQDIVHHKIQIAAFFDHLLHRQVKINYGTMYESEARQELIGLNLPSEEQFMRALQEDFWYAISDPWRSDAHPNSPRVVVVEEDGVDTQTLLEVYSDWCKRNGFRSRGAVKLGSALQEYFPAVKQGRARVGGIRKRVWFGIPMHPVVVDFPAQKMLEKQSDTPDFDAGA